jgi:hypothetical protein
VQADRQVGLNRLAINTLAEPSAGGAHGVSHSRSRITSWAFRRRTTAFSHDVCL